MISKFTLLKSILLSVVLFSTIVVNAQTDGDYRTVGSGSLNWSAVGSWEVYASGWGAATEYPGQSAGTGVVTIADGAAVTLNVTPANPIGGFIVNGTFQTSNDNRAFTVNGDLSVGATGDFNIRRCNPLTVTGNSSISGLLRDNNNNGSAVFQGSLTIEVGGEFSTANSSAFTFQNGIVNNGTFNKTGYGVITFNTNSQSVSGSALTLNASYFYINDDITLDVSVGDINIDRDFQNNSNAAVALNATAGTFIFRRNNTQYINNGTGTGTVTFYDLETTRGGTKYFSRSFDIANNLTETLGNIVTYTGTYNVGNDVTNVASTFNVYQGDFTIGRDLIVSNAMRDSDTSGSLTINGNVQVNASGNFDIERLVFSVQGTTTVDGILRDTRNEGSNSFGDLFTVNNGASYVTNNTSPHTFGNSIVNNGDCRIYNAGVSIDFTTNSQTITGTSSVILDGTITIADGLTLTNQLTDVTDGLIIEGTINGATGASNFVNEQFLSVRGANGPMLTTGVFDVSAIGNTVRYDRNDVQDITPVAYYDLIIVGSNYQNKYLTANTSVLNDFTVDTNGDFFPEAFDFSVAGNTIITGRIYDRDLNGTSSFQDVDLSNGRFSGGVNGVYIINGNLTMPTAYGRIERCNITITGTTDIAVGSNLTLNNNNGTKIFNGKITADGDWLNTGNESVEIRNGFDFNGAIFTSGSGTYNFTVNDQSFATANAVTFSGGITVGDGVTFVNDNSEITTGTTVNGAISGVSATSVFENRGVVTYNSGTKPMTTGVLDASNSPNTFNYYRANNQTIKDATYDVLQLSNSGTKTFGGDVTVLSSFETSELVTVNVDCNTYDLTLGGSHSLGATGTFITDPTTNVSYNGSGDQDIMDISYAGDITASGTGVKSITSDISVNGNVTINSGSSLNISDNLTLSLADASVVTNNGILQVVGTSGNPATLTTSGSGGYTINQTDAAAEFHAAYGVFDATGGITISDGTVDATNNFNNCIFSNGTGSEYLNLSGLEPIGGLNSIQSVDFGSGPSFNVTRTAGTTPVTFVQATGTLSGENNDKDNSNPGTLITWTDPSSIYYSTGDVSANLASSWNSAEDGTGGNPLLSKLSDGTLTLIVQDGHTVTLDNNGDIDVKELIVGEGVSGSFVIGGDATQQTLTIQELLEVKTGGSLIPGSGGEPAHILRLYGNMVNDGTVNLRNNFTILVNTEIYGNMVFSGSVSPVFSKMTFMSGCDATSDVGLDINGNLILESGAIFNDGGNSHTLEYNWTNNGGTYNATGGLVFDGVSASITSSGTNTTFNDVTFNSGGSNTIKQTAIFNGDFIISNNTTVSVDNIGLTVNGNYNIEAGSEYAQLANSTYFSGTEAQTITLNGTTEFNRIYFRNGGVNAKTIVGDVNVNEWLMIDNGATVDGSGDHSIRSGLRVNGTCNFSGSITMRGGTIDATDASVTSFDLGTAELICEGTVYVSNNTGGGILDVRANNDVTVTSGSLVVNIGANLDGLAGNKLSVGAGRNLYIRGADNFPDGFGTYDFDETSLIVYDGQMDQIVRTGITYPRLYLRYDYIKTVDGPLNFTGQLYLINEVTFDLLNYNHVFSGSSISNGTGNNGSIDGSDASFTIGGGDYNQSFAANGTGVYTFKDLILTQNGATATRTKTFSSDCDVVVTGNLTVENIGGTEAIQQIVNLNDNVITGSGGTFTLGANCRLDVDHLDFGTDVLDNFTSTDFDVNSTVYYTLNGGDGSGGNPIDPAKDQLISNSVSYGNLALYHGNKRAQGDLQIKGNLYRTGNPVFYDEGNTIYIAGNWELFYDRYYTQASATGTVVFGEVDGVGGVDQDINGYNFNNIVIGSSGTANLFNTLRIYGDITVNDGSAFNVSTLPMYIGGDITVNGTGVYSQTTGRTTLNGDANQNITLSSGSNFGYLTIDKPNPATQTITALSDVKILHDLVLEENEGIFDISNQNLYVGRRLYIRNNRVAGVPTQNFITDGSTIYLNGTAAQYFYVYHENALKLNNLVFEGSGDKWLQYINPGGGLLAADNIQIDGDVTINSSVVDGYNVNLYVKGDWTNNGTFNHSRTVYFDGDDQNISSSGFYITRFTGTGTKTLTGNINVSRDVYIEGAATLNAAGKDITLGRHWYNEEVNAGYSAGNGVDGYGKVVFNSAYGAYIYSGTSTGTVAGKTFYAVDINKTIDGYVYLAGDLVVEQDLNVNSNRLRTNAYDVWVGGDFDVEGTYECTNNNSMLTLNATGGTNIFNPNGASLRGLTINAPGATYEMQSDFILDNVDMSIDAGTLNINENEISLLDASRKIDINGGVLNVGAGSTIQFSNVQSINLTSGELYLVGEEGNMAMLLNSSGSAFTINATGGDFYANYYRVQKGNITVNGATLNATANLSNGTYVEGANVTSYITLTDVELGSGITLNNMIFNSGDVNTKNITRASGNGVVTVTDPSGALAGEYYELDGGNLIDWTFPAGFFWDGEAVDDNWNSALNWDGNTLPGVDDIVYLDHKHVAGVYTINVAADASCMRVNMDTQSGNAIGLTVASGNTLNVTEHVNIGVGATITQENVGVNPSMINVGKNWTNQGTYVHGDSKVVFNAASGNYIISSGSGAFYDLQLDAGTSVYTLDLPMTVENDMTISSGTLDLASASNDVTVGGDWMVDQANGGSFISNNATVTFNGVDQSVTNGTFYDLTIAGSGTTTLNSSIAVDHNVVLNSGSSLDAGDRDIYVRGTWDNNGGAFAQTGLGTIVFDGSAGNQLIDNDTAPFNSLTFSNAATKTLTNDVSVNGNVLINESSGVMNVSTYQLTGAGSNNKLTSNGRLEIEGESNFPNGFESIDFSSTSRVYYYSDNDQDIYPTTYGHLYLRRDSSDPVDPIPTKTAIGDLEIIGNLYLNDVNRPVEFDMSSGTGYKLLLTGSIDLRGLSTITWGTEDGTLEHVGGNWNIDADIPTFNHLILAGTGDKRTYGDISVTGDLIIKSDVDLYMWGSLGRNDFKKVTGTASGTISMETGARILDSRPSTDGVAIPEGFGTYDFNENSTYYLYSDGIDQTVYTGSDITYGILISASTKNITGDGVANLDVNGNYDLNTATYYDGGKDIELAGADIYFNNYVASSVDRKLILDGVRDQVLRDDVNNILDLATLQFSGTGVKTITETTNVSGNWIIDTDVTAKTGNNINFSGSSWTNNGYYQQTGNSLTFNGVSDQTIDAGTPDANNYFRSLIFEGASTKTFVNNGANINDDITIKAGTVDLGNLVYYLADELYNILGGTLLSGNADLILDGTAQYIQSPNFTIDNITCSGSSTKYLCSDWTINSDLIIESGARLDSRSVISGVTTDYDIYIGGDWINEGTFYHRNKKVTFNGYLSPVTITGGGSNFYDVEFAPTASVNYSLLSASTSITNQMDVGSNALLSLNSKKLVLGRNNTGTVTHTVNGTLTVNEDAILDINNDDQQTTLDVYGTLNIVGSSDTNVATLTSSTVATNRNKTLVVINAGATMAARYYLIEYIADEGLNLLQNSILDPVNNFSDGTFLGMRNQAGVRYIVLESDYAGTISNITFSYDGTPIKGTHYNVERKLGTGDVSFENVTGALGTYYYEDDDQAVAYDNGKLRWPEVTETNWTGSINANWHDDRNWDNGVPIPTIDAIIEDKDNDPVIFSGNAECKNLLITGDGVLSLADEMDLSIYGNVSVDDGAFYVLDELSEMTVSGDWNVNTQGIFEHGDGTVTFNSASGSVSIVPRTQSFNNVIFDNAVTTFNISGTEVDFDGDVTIYNGTVSPSSNNYIYNFYGDYTITGGVFNANSSNRGTIVLKAEGNQTVTKGMFDYLTVDGSGNKYFAGVNTVQRNTVINSTLEAQAGSSILFNGDMNIDAAGTFNDGGESHEFKGYRWYGDGAYLGDGTMTFNKTNNNQYLYSGTFNNLVVDCAGRVLYLEGDVNINGDLTFKESINQVNLGTNTFTSNGTGTFTVESGVYVYVYGANNFPKAFDTYSLDATSITRYWGSSDQNVDGVSYGQLHLYYANTKTLTGDTEVKGQILFYAATLDVSTNNYTLTVGSRWNNNTSGGQFICREGEVIFTNTVNDNIYFNDGNLNDFYDLTINGTARVTAANASNNDFIVKNNLHVTGGEFNASGKYIYVGGDLVASSSGGFYPSGTYYLNKASGSANVGLNGSSLWSLIINSGATYTVQDDMQLTGTYTLTSGTFDGNGNNIDIGNDGTDVVVINGTYKIGSGGVLGLGNGTTCTVGTTGRIEVVGSESGLAKVTNNSSGGRYTFQVDGEIAAEYYMFEYMSNVGIYLTSSSTIDATSHFSNGTFSNGTGSGQMFRVENTQSFTGESNRIENVSFPKHPGGTASNVAKFDASAGTLEFYNSTGVFAGETYDNDTRNLINWTGPVALYWNGSASTDWNTAANWTASSGPSIVPTAENNVFIIGGITKQPEITVAGQETGNLTIEEGARIRINTLAGELESDLDIDGDLIIDGDISTNSTEDMITVEGNWTASSSSTILLNGNVTFDGVGGAKQIDNRNNSFYSLTIAGSSQYQIVRDIEIDHDLVINSGATFDVNPADYDVTVSGTWTNNGSFLAQQGTVVLDAASGPISLTTGGFDFYNLQIDASGVTFNQVGNMGVSHNLQIFDGTLDVGTNTLKIGDGSGTDNVSVSGTLLINGGATLDLSSGSTLNVNNGGSMELLGTDDANRAVMTSSTGGRYSFDVNSGASIKAQYYTVDYTDADGLYMHPGANIDAVNNLSDGIFSNGASGGSYMTLLHNMVDAEFTLSNLEFNPGPNHSVTRTSGTTIFHFEDATGDLGNYLYERDDEATASPSSGLLRWPFVNLYTWEGDVDNNWLNAANWFDDQLPVTTADVTIPNTGLNPIIDNSQLYEIHGLEIEPGATVTIEEGARLTLAGDITNNGSLIVNNSVTSPTSIIVDGTTSGDATYNWTGFTPFGWWHIAHPVSGVMEGEYDSSFGAGRYALNIFSSSGWQRVAGFSSNGAEYDFDVNPAIEGYNLYSAEGGKTLNYDGAFHNDASYSSITTEARWYHVGNPYPSFIDIEESGFNLGNFRKTVYVRENSDQVSSYNILNHTGVNNGSRYIAPGQCMWLRTDYGTDAFSIAKSTRTHSSDGLGLKNATISENDKLRFTFQSDYGKDEAVVIFNESGSDFVTPYDSEKLMNGGKLANFFSLKEGKSIAVNSMPVLEGSEIVSMGYEVSTEGMSDFTIKATNLTSFMPEVEVYLFDKVAGVTVNLREEPTYTFTPEAIAENNRFELKFEAMTTDLDDNESVVSKRNVSIYSVKQRATVKVALDLLKGKDRLIEVYDIAGQRIAEYEINSTETNFELPHADMIYIIKVSIDMFSYQGKVISKM